MYIHFKPLLSAVLLLSFVMPIFSFEPSGGVLVLDGEDDYAILPLAEHGYIFPRNTDGNGKTLIGMNGAAVMGGGGVGNLEIHPDNSLATTWGQVKSESF